MKRPAAFGLAFPGLCLAMILNGQPADTSGHTSVGRIAPDFSAMTLEGRSFTLSEMKGRPVVINFFAIWCPSCRMELPELQKTVWEPFRNAGLEVLAVGREHTAAELDTFRVRHGFTFDFAPDPDRSIFRLYADKFIPRTLLVGRDGRIVFQTLGYKPGDMDTLALRVADALKP
ncbi:TlpA family protein disulfide reductase [bacterium]|nr:TlpA family protein disulfide reductase [bacterium]